jgi:hypothetical protein
VKIADIKPYIAPRYWFTALGVVLILLGLTGGTEVAGIDLVIEDPVMGYIAVFLGCVCMIGAYRIYRKWVKSQ